MKVNAYQKDRNIALFYGFLAVAFIPSLMWLLKERPLSSDSAQDLILRTKEREEHKLAFQMNLPPQGFSLSRDETNNRWNRLQSQIANADNETDAARIVSIAREQWKDAGSLAPVFASLGYLNGEKVWTLECAFVPNVLYICLPTAAEKAAIRKEAMLYRVVVISADAPYRVLDEQKKLRSNYLTYNSY